MIGQGQTQQNLFADPGDSEVVVFEATQRLTGFQGNQLWMGATGVSKDWGSCNVLASEDGTTYLQVGTINAIARLGVLDSTFASGSDPDTTHSLVVDLVENSAMLEAGTSADADSGNTLLYVDGEVIAYSAAAVTGPDQYTLDTYIRRGQRGSVISSHSAGGLVMRLDDTVFKFTYDPTWAGKTIYLKFQSVNTFGNAPQDVSTLTPLTFTIPGVNPGTVDAGSGLVAVHGTRAAHTTYRPLSNPLTATDAGSNATINVASFSMRVPGIPDISLNSGTIAGLSYATTYYVFYDDPTYAGGAVTYAASATKEDALNGTGRFFVGSITTPAHGGFATTGNNDGGSSAQQGNIMRVAPSSAFSSASGAGGQVWTSPGNMNDLDPTTFASITHTGVGSSGSGLLQAQQFGLSVMNSASAVTLKLIHEITSNTLNSVANVYTVSASWFLLDGTSGGATIRQVVAGTLAKTLESYALPANVDIGRVVLLIDDHVTPTDTSGSRAAKVYAAWIEVAF